jgi:hypothetical protein
MIDIRGPHVALVHTYYMCQTNGFEKKDKDHWSLPQLKTNLWVITSWWPSVTIGVSHYGFAIYFLKYLKAKEELWKLKYFTMQNYINFQKIV